MSEMWERLQGETDTQFNAFTVYRDLIPHHRSIRNAAAKSYGLTIPYSHTTNTADVRRKVTSRQTLWGRYSLANQWPNRVHAWDDYVDTIRRGDQIEAVRNMSIEQANLGKAIWNAAVRALNEVLAERQIGRPSDRVVLAFAAEGAKIQRAAYGLNVYVDEVDGRVADPQLVPRALIESDPGIAAATARLALAEAQALRRQREGTTP